MSIVAEQKSQLAKLMATENITVEHRKIQTAGFDTKNRVLYLPIWKNMSGDIYDLLTGHEVGHALYTPADGWHDAIAPSDKNRNYKNFLNVVEDARIEKKIKRRYPGLKPSFLRAYNELFERDFFGLKGRDINRMSFIDRLNIFTKSQYTANYIKFSAVEELILKKLESVETWEDVVRLTDEIYEYSKEEQFETYQEQLKELQADEYDDFDDSFDDGDYGDDYDDYEEDDNSNEDGKTNKSSNEEGEPIESKDSNESEEDESLDENGEPTNTNHYKDSSVSTKDQFSPSCETDENYRANESRLLDEKCKEYVYLEIPKVNLKNVITPANIVQKKNTEFFEDAVKNGYLDNTKVNDWVQEFKNKNERYVGLLAKEFEMRKAAKAFSKSKLSDTGDIDVNKLATYKFDDNIFRKVMMQPKGKSHGLILLLDKSGSMSDNMAGSIEQILVLAMFCRKVNIPFVVYGFGDSVESRRFDLGKNPYEPFETSNCFETRLNVLSFSNVYLREYINSQMSNVEFTKALRNMIVIKKSYERGFHVLRHEGEHLSNTPLTQAIVALAPIMKDFKKKNNLDLTNLVIVHDGDADWNTASYVEVERTDRMGKTYKALTAYNFAFSSKNYILRDKANDFECRLNPDNVNRDYNYRGDFDLNSVILKWFSKTTGSKVFGFFLVPTHKSKYAISNHYYLENGQTIYEKSRNRKTNEELLEFDVLNKKLVKEFKTEKFLLTKHRSGFDSFFLVSGGSELITTNDEIEVEGKMTASKLKNAFMKFNKKKAVNRVLVSKFIEGIAA